MSTAARQLPGSLGRAPSTVSAESRRGVAFCGTASKPRASGGGVWAKAVEVARQATSPALSAAALIRGHEYRNSGSFRRNRRSSARSGRKIAYTRLNGSVARLLSAGERGRPGFDGGTEALGRVPSGPDTRKSRRQRHKSQRRR